MISIKSSREIELMRQTCRLAAETLDYAGSLVQAGRSTLEINDMVHEYIIERGAYPSPLNYNGFPKSICTSLNDVVCHGIPHKKDILKDGDLLNIDVTTYLNSFHGDTNRTFLVGEASSETQKLVETTLKATLAGIETVQDGSHLGDVGEAIQEIAESAGYSVVRDYCGHGIGREFHEEPQVLHYGRKGTGVKLKEGMTFTIEPMINLGRKETTLMDDGWTAKTKDGSLSAQFEHTILVTKTGADILTTWPEKSENGPN